MGVAQARCCAVNLPSKGERSDVQAIRTAKTVTELAEVKTAAQMKSLYSDKGPLAKRSGKCKVTEVTCRTSSGKYVCRRLPASQMPCKNMQMVNKHCQALSGMEHPHICKFLEAFKDENFIYLIYEKADTVTLFEYICERSRLTEEESADYVRQIIMALSVAQASGVAHGRLSPRSLILAFPERDEEEESLAQVKICDMGQAFILRPPVAHGAEAEGEPMDERVRYYMSPELASQELTADEKGVTPSKAYASDIWALGCVVYHMLTGTAPFACNSHTDMLNAVQFQRPAFPAEAWAKLSPEARDCVEDMLKVNVGIRFSASQLLRHPWVKVAKTTFPRKRMQHLLACLRTNLSEGEFKRFVLRVVAEQLPSDGRHVETVETAFRCLDRNGDGVLTLEELSKGMQSFLGTSSGELDALFAQVDRDGSGTLSVVEFISATMDQQQMTSMPTLWQAFCAFDKDMSGSVSFDEIDKIVKEIEGALLSKEQVNELCREIRGELEACHGNKEEVDFDQFVYIMHNKEASCKQAALKDLSRMAFSKCGHDCHKVRHMKPRQWNLKDKGDANVSSPRSVYKRRRGSANPGRPAAAG